MNSSPDAALKKIHIRRVFETARYFWEMWEEGAQGDTRAIACILPLGKSVTVRELVLANSYQLRGLSLREAAFELAEWLTVYHDAPPFDNAMGAELVALCQDAAKPFTTVRDNETIIQRSFVRLVRYLQQKRLAKEGAHSRCFEYFIAAEHVPTGFGKMGGTYPEHVVPCAFLRDRCTARLEQGASIEEVAQEIRPFLAIVMITVEEAPYLDKSESNDGLGLKDIMPDDWTFETGDIFERLHIAGIEFEAPISR